MTGMTDSRAVEVLAEMRKDGGTVAEADYTAAIDHAIARLREPAGGVVWRCLTARIALFRRRARGVARIALSAVRCASSTRPQSLPPPSHLPRRRP